MFKTQPVRAQPGRSLTRLPLRRVHACPSQPRREFPAESIEALAESIRLHGLLSPLLVGRLEASIGWWPGSDGCAR